MIFYFYFYFWPEEPAAPVLTSPADSLRDSRYGPRRGRTQQAGAAPHGLGADAPQEDHYSGLAAPPSEMCRRKIGDDATVIIVFLFLICEVRRTRTSVSMIVSRESCTNRLSRCIAPG